MEKIKWSEKVTNEQVIDRIGEKRTLLNNILRRKADWIGHILRRTQVSEDFGKLSESNYIILRNVLTRRREYGTYLATARRHRRRIKMQKRDE